MLFCTALIAGVTALIEDRRCTVPVLGTLKFAKTAVNCEDKLSDDKCKMFFMNGIKVGSDVDRHTSCFKVERHFSQFVLIMIINYSQLNTKEKMTSFFFE
ncbi:hypothetical protein DICVIV_14451 [Dictyocaulus viviparus]|uniref:Uncharacterized protein n=1 Tax=Dictyocaulus viviparus TaxID=29172 RepID=A0A0D8X791_DICVI|nr:hypothetical protein DICVIV_14451 [Dictyocaulus viviparus]